MSELALREESKDLRKYAKTTTSSSKCELGKLDT
jgi:hypothetical protein